MNTYIEPYITADKILDYYNAANRNRIEETEIHNSLDIASQKEFRSAIHQLIEDKCIKHDSNSGHFYLLLGRGAALQAQGGYEERFNRENSFQQFKADLDNSLLEANRSVSKTNRVSRKVMRLTLIVLIVSAAVTIGNLWISIHESPHKEAQEKLQEELLRQLILQNSEQHQKNHPTSKDSISFP